MQFIYEQSALVNKQEVLDSLNGLGEYHAHLCDVINNGGYDDPEASLNLPGDQLLMKSVLDLQKKKQSPELKYIVVIGIGGSNLGTKAIYDALLGYYDLFSPTRFPKIIFLDTQDEEILAKSIALLQSLSTKNEFIINALSKSGGTTETMANLEVVYKALQDKFGDIHDRIVITTDEGSPLFQKAQEKGIDTLTLPKLVGGRFSVLSAIGLFPLAMAGINVELLRQSAKVMRDTCLLSIDAQNAAAVSASVLYHHAQNGVNIHDLFIFLPQLESLGKWYRQLMGESIGKDGKGITPTVSIGSTDLHSVGQLYLGGPHDKFTSFIYGKDSKYEALLPKEGVFNLIENLNGKKIPEIMHAIISGTKIAYQNQHIPFMEVAFDTVNEASLGEFMQFSMLQMMYLGKLMSINTFNQPHVELYKTETKKILKG